MLHLEVGLGGRLDAMNLVRAPVVCGITSLGMDHVEVLDTAKIAREKAGMANPASPRSRRRSRRRRWRRSRRARGSRRARRRSRRRSGRTKATRRPTTAAAAAAARRAKKGLSKTRPDPAGAHRANARSRFALREWARRARPQPAWARACEADSRRVPRRLPRPRGRSGGAARGWSPIRRRAPGLPVPQARTRRSPCGSARVVLRRHGAADEPSSADGERDDAPEAAREGEVPGTNGDEPSSEAGGTGGTTHLVGGGDRGTTRLVGGGDRAGPSAAAPDRLLLFNCMEERDETLLAPLAGPRGPRPALTDALRPGERARASSCRGPGRVHRVATDRREGVGRPLRADEQTSEEGGRRRRRRYWGGSSSSPKNRRQKSRADPRTGRAWDAPRASAVAPCLSRAVSGYVTAADSEAQDGRRVRVLVAGSLCLVGDMLRTGPGGTEGRVVPEYNGAGIVECGVG